MSNWPHTQTNKWLQKLEWSDISVADRVQTTLDTLYANCQGGLNELNALAIPGDPDDFDADFSSHTFQIPAILSSASSGDLTTYYGHMRNLRLQLGGAAGYIRQIVKLAGKDSGAGSPTI